MSCKKRKVHPSDSTIKAAEAAVDIMFRCIPEEKRYDTESFWKAQRHESGTGESRTGLRRVLLAGLGICKNWASKGFSD
jgi:hypothetical protein